MLSVLQNKLNALQVLFNLSNFILNILTERSVNMTIGDHEISHRVQHRGQYSVRFYTIINQVKILQYADDLLLYYSSQSVEQACAVMNSALSTLSSWLHINALSHP